MKFEILTEKLSSAISLADRITGKNLSLPILSYVLLDFKNNLLTINATNLDLGIIIKVPVKGSGQVKIAIPGKILGNLLSSLLNEKNIFLEVDGLNLKVVSNFSESIIKALAHDDFPNIPEIKGGSVINIQKNTLSGGFKSVVYSASNSTIKPELSSVYMYCENNEIVFVSTDSFRLAEKKVALKKDLDFPPILIPAKNVGEIIKVLEYMPDEAQFIVGKHQIAIMSANLYISSRTIEGNFPDYRQIIPKNTEIEAIVLKQDLMNSIKTAHVFSDKFNQVKIQHKNKTKEIIINVKNADIGEHVEKIPSKVVGGEVDMNFNYRYIADSLPFIPAESLVMSFNGSHKPLIMKGYNDTSFLYLVMPMNR